MARLWVVCKLMVCEDAAGDETSSSDLVMVLHFLKAVAIVPAVT